MSDKPKYSIAEGNSGKILEGEVNRKIEQGYLPFGNVTYYNCLLQPMMLKEHEGNSLIKITDEKQDND